MRGKQNNYTSIGLLFKTRDRLAELCGKRRTYDEFLKELMDRPKIKLEEITVSRFYQIKVQMMREKLMEFMSDDDFLNELMDKYEMKGEC